MKAYLAIFLALFTALSVRAQSDSLGLPGDDLNLCGVLEIFKTSKSPDDFEKALNKKDKKINNLDLNRDGKVDYLRVIDNKQGDAHVLIIRDAISKTESQDVAVIEIEKKGEKNAQLQIVGDPELYGKDYIIEPKPDNSGSDKKWQEFAPQFVIVNVWYWPVVSYMWYPDYVVWVSPWYYGYYPSWWYPWAPMPYYTYYEYVYVYHDYYYWTNDYRCNYAHSVYQPRRVVSTTVHQYAAPQHQHAAPRTANGQSPVPVRKPTNSDRVAPRGGNPQSSPAPRQGQDASKAPRKQSADPSKAPRGKQPRSGKQESSPAPRGKQESSPAPRGKQESSPAPRGKQESTPAPRDNQKSSPAPRGNDQTSPAPRQQDASPAPAPRRQDAPRQPRQPRQERRPDVQPSPSPRPSPQPQPQPRAPRGNPRPR